MEGARAASGEDQDGAEFPMEPLGSRVPELEQPQVPAEERRPESPESSPSLAPAVKEEARAGQDLSGGKKLPSPRPAPLRLLPSSPGYSAFRRQESASPELPSPGPAAAEQPRDGETPGVEQMLRAAPGEPARGAWAPMELQVDVRVKSVGAAGSSCAPSPAPSTRFLTVPVPESPAFSHHASPAHPLLRLTPSPGGTWGRGTPLAAARTERDLDAEGWAGPAEGRAESPGSPTCRCRCRCKEDAVLHAEMDGDKKLSRVIKLVGLPEQIPSHQVLLGGGPTRPPGLALDRWDPSATPATPGGRPARTGSQLRGPGGRQVRGFGLCLPQTLGLRQGDQVTWVLPALSLLGEARLRAGAASSPDPGLQVSPLCSVAPPRRSRERTPGAGRSHPRDRRRSAAPRLSAHLSVQLLKWICSVTLWVFLVLRFSF
ncbi:killer cell lectin-like receptor subfamily G member 2 isoform X2 [Tursiops truncatus]|uniref:Killer cell lectin-like receptor subfamily G member 2 isoform X2 n=1 Tax=Tursiops truncatus TaxID=9739 RepID=A0A2U4CAG6_TURTR|nr:killer cell lectin-like receptor subfamily G member 2 isoform X2 [Tursiops truncatus]